MKTNDFDYYLPETLIAQSPLLKRDNSKLMVLDVENQTEEHCHFYDIIDKIPPQSCLVLNDTKVIPARLLAHKKESMIPVEILLLRRINTDTWECILKPGRRLKEGSKVVFPEYDLALECEVLEVLENGNRIIKFQYEGIWEEILEKIGQMPLPPYIHEKLEDKNRYQTIYAKHQGSAAAPTAGLHFTQELIDKMQKKNIKMVYLTLHVGLGTFRPVKVENINEHHMHSEFYYLSENAASIINQSIKNGQKIIAVGTTSARTLESLAYYDESENKYLVKSQSGFTDIFIYPGVKTRIIDALITNFHLPKSSLIMLVSALAGREFILESYKKAVEHEYRFFSFGDAMFINGNISKNKTR